MSIIETTIRKGSKNWPKIHCFKCDKFIRSIDAEELEKWPIQEICKECKIIDYKKSELRSELSYPMYCFIKAIEETLSEEGKGEDLIESFIELMETYERNR